MKLHLAVQFGVEHGVQLEVKLGVKLEVKLGSTSFEAGRLM